MVVEKLSLYVASTITVYQRYYDSLSEGAFIIYELILAGIRRISNMPTF